MNQKCLTDWVLSSQMTLIYNQGNPLNLLESDVRLEQIYLS